MLVVRREGQVEERELTMCLSPPNTLSDKTLRSSLYHVILGLGKPVALHSSTRLLPSVTVCPPVTDVIFAGSTKCILYLSTRGALSAGVPAPLPPLQFDILRLHKPAGTIMAAYFNSLI